MKPEPSYYSSYRLNADEVGVLCSCVEDELDRTHNSNIPFEAIAQAVEDEDFEEDAISDVRYVARLALIMAELQGLRGPR